jgi:hypothetical protein
MIDDNFRKAQMDSINSIPEVFFHWLDSLNCGLGGYRCWHSTGWLIDARVRDEQYKFEGGTRVKVGCITVQYTCTILKFTWVVRVTAM